MDKIVSTSIVTRKFVVITTTPTDYSIRIVEQTTEEIENNGFSDIGYDGNETYGFMTSTAYTRDIHIVDMEIGDTIEVDDGVIATRIA